MLSTVAALVLVALSVWLVLPGGGGAERRPTLARAVDQTARAQSERYAIHVTMKRDGMPLSLHIRGQENLHTISLQLRMGAVRLPDGTKVPGPDGAALLDGPFLYERAPTGVTLGGRIHWLRLRIPRLPAHLPELGVVHALTPAPLLGLLRVARVASVTGSTRSFQGTLAYGNPAVRDGLARLTGGLEIRGLHVWARVGGDGLVHRVVITGRTADRRTTFSLRAHLFGFGKGIHVTPPAPGTFIDKHDTITA